MSAVPKVPIIDPEPILSLIRQRGECSFDDAINVLRERGMDSTRARDAIWQLLSDGVIQFTTDRHLTMPAADVFHPAAQ